MEVEVLAGITVNVLQRHVVVEERVPLCREMHAPVLGPPVDRARLRCNEAITIFIFVPIR